MSEWRQHLLPRKVSGQAEPKTCGITVKNVWKKTSFYSRLCQSDTCPGLLELKTPANKNLGIFQLTKHWFSVRRNVAGQLIRCFVNTLTKECTYCLSLLYCIHVKAVEDQDIKHRGWTSNLIFNHNIVINI